MPESLFSKILHPPQTTDVWEQLAAVVIHRILIFGFIILISLAISLIFSPIALELVRLSVLAVWLLVCLILLTRLKFQIASYALVWGSWVIMAIIAFMGAGIYSNTYWLFIFLLIPGGILLGTRSFLTLTGTTLIYSLILCVATIQGVTKPVSHPSPVLFTWIVSAGIFLITAYIIYIVKCTMVNSILQIQSDRAFYQAIVDDQTEYIVRWKPDGTRTFVNEAYCRYYGISREEAIGTGIFSKMSEQNKLLLQDAQKNLSPENPIYTGEVRVIRPDNTIGWQQWSDRAFYDDKGQIIEYQSVGRDITAIKELEEKQQELLITRERESFLRDFLSTMTHDLQTPLSVMRTNLYLMKQKHTPENITKRSAGIELQIKKLSNMIEDILTSARLEHLPALDLQTINISEMLDNIIELLSTYAQSKAITIEKSPPRDSKIVADITELPRALTNLIENAIKYTPEKGTVSIICEEDENGISIQIQDTGIGISAEDLPNIFSRFYRADNAKDFEKGTGLGLVIVKRIIELHSGTISVESEFNEGTRFLVYLPVKPSQHESIDTPILQADTVNTG